VTRIGPWWAASAVVLVAAGAAVLTAETTVPIARASLALWRRGLPLTHHAAAVHVASRSDDVELLALLHAAGADLGAPNAEGDTALHVAAASGAPWAAAFLVANGIDVDDQGRTGPPLALALEEGHLDVARVLLEHGADVRVRLGRERRPAAVQVALTGDVRKMNLLLGLGIPPDVADADGLTALAHAFSRNDDPMARALLAAGATPHVDPTGPDRSLLEGAIRDGRRDLVELLLAHGADATVLSHEGQPLLPVAVALGRVEVAAALLDAGVAVDTELAPAASEEFLALVPGTHARFYLTRDEGVRPLMVAVLRGDREMTRLLLERGASVGPTRKLFKYPLGMAADREDITMMQVLLGRDPQEAASTRRIVVSLSQQRATLYEGGRSTLQTSISTGRKGFRTPPGEYVITDKHRHWRSTLYPVDMPYFMRLSGGEMGLHEGVVRSQPASHGCIRVPPAAARTLYQRMRLGDPVTVVP
jgi:ankyrin repeat protein